MAAMAKKKQAAAESPEQDGALVKATKAIGEAAGKIATAVGVTKPAKKRVPKLEKKEKVRLPRKEKKAAKKASKKSA
jgi:hypothetical protein